MMENNFSVFIKNFYFRKLITKTSTGMPEDCISNSQDFVSKKNRKEFKNGKDLALSLYLESSV